MSGPRAERRDQQPDRRYEPDHRDDDQGDVDRRARDELDDSPRERGRLRADELGGLGRHPWIAWLRKRLMLNAMIGMIRSSITTAIAEP